MTDIIQVATTTSRQDEARRIADALVQQRLAACVQISGPISSIYRWQGAVHADEEWLCTIKTSQALFDRVETAIRQLHSYDEPEILAVLVVACSGGYRQWLHAQLDVGPPAGE